MRIGDLEIHLLCDGLVRADAGGPFGLVPRVLYQRYWVPDEDNTIPESLTCMLVRSRGKTILIDTGLGYRVTEKEVRNWRLTRPEGGLLEGLARLGISPEEVDIVINTHLHSDHCGGNTLWQGERLVPAFPRALYLVQRIEWAEACHPDARTRGTYFRENFEPLLAEGRMRLLHGDTVITDQVRCVVTPGHTRAHQCVLLESGDWKGLFVGDMAGHAVHMERTAWVTAFDVLPLENIATKQIWQRWALEHDAWLFFQHDPRTPVGRLVEEGGRLRVEPRPEAEELTASIPTPQPPLG